MLVILHWFPLEFPFLLLVLLLLHMNYIDFLPSYACKTKLVEIEK